MSTLDKIIDLYEKSGRNQKDLTDYLGLEKSTFSAWKSGKSASYKKYIPKIAKFYNVTTDYLLNDDNSLVQSNIETIPNTNVHMIPVFEKVSAGFGAYACSDVIGYNPVIINNPSDVSDTICIKVTGDSMYPKIEDGDTIVVRKQSSVDSGQIAVVMIDNEEGLVKKVTYGNDWVELISINPMYPPRRFEGEDVSHLSVVGLVKQIIKNVWFMVDKIPTMCYTVILPYWRISPIWYGFIISLIFVIINWHIPRILVIYLSIFWQGEWDD